jgi:uncharacterized protein
VKIVWDESKRHINLEKHGLDFAEFERGFSWERFVTIPSRPSLTTQRRRAQLVGRLNDVIVVAVVSPLGSEALSLISLRPANLKERARYAER